MDNEDLLSFIAGSRFKTARRKKQLQKKDVEKHLLYLDRKEDDLRERRRKLPMVPLETPYQRGWNRFFVLREDVARSSQVDFYHALLEKINTVQYSANKSFYARKRRKRKSIQAVKQQLLQSFYQWEFYSPRFKLTDRERVHFHPKEVKSRCGRYLELKYFFNEPWRYTLCIKPNMITHKKLVDEVLNQEIDQLRNHIERNNLRGKMNKLAYGYDYHWRWDFPDKRAFDPLKNKPLYAIIADYKAGQI